VQQLPAEPIIEQLSEVEDGSGRSQGTDDTPGLGLSREPHCTLCGFLVAPATQGETDVPVRCTPDTVHFYAAYVQRPAALGFAVT